MGSLAGGGVRPTFDSDQLAWQLKSPGRRTGTGLSCAGRPGRPGADAMLARGVEKLGDGTLELGKAGVHLNYLVRADWFRWVNVGLVLRPLVSAVTAMERVAVGP